MPYPPEHKQKTRQRILAAARCEFQARGYDGVGIDALMSAAGLTRGGFYAHFESKEELFAEVLDQLTGPAQTRRRLSEDPHTAVAEFIRAYLSEPHQRDLAGGCALAALSPDVARSGPVAKAAYGRFIARSTERLGRGIATDRRAGKATAILATCLGGLVMSRAVADPRQARRILRACRDAALGLLEE